MSRAYESTTFADAWYGRCQSAPQKRVCIGMVVTTLDIWFPGVETPDLAPAGHHVASILVHCAPYDLEGGWNEETKESLYDAVLDVLSSYAPGIQALVVGREILSPADLDIYERDGTKEPRCCRSGGAVPLPGPTPGLPGRVLQQPTSAAECS